MKKTILSIIALITVVLGTTNFSNAANLNNAAATTLTDISAINKIEIHGNVELFVSDGNADQVKVYNQYYTESALVQSSNGTLRITSYKAEKLVVWVTAADLRSIVAYDNSTVRSFGDLSKIEFNVELHNNATAKLNLDAFKADVTVNDHATAELTGNANQFNLSHDFTSTVNNYSFKAEHFNENKINFPTAADFNDIIGA